MCQHADAEVVSCPTCMLGWHESCVASLAAAIKSSSHVQAQCGSLATSASKAALLSMTSCCSRCAVCELASSTADV
eukprot:5616700-Heterocapsa_arctica.AAC.1